MRKLLYISFIFLSTQLAGQSLDVILDKDIVHVEILQTAQKLHIIDSLKGVVKQDLHKEWTRNTYQLQDASIVLELYDGSAIWFGDRKDYSKLNTIRFVMNYIDIYKKNISYKYSIDKIQFRNLKKNSKHLEFKSERPDLYKYHVYQLSDNRVLFSITASNNVQNTVYANLKTLAADSQAIPNEGNSEILDQMIIADNDRDIDEVWGEMLVSGDPMNDFENRMFIVYPHQTETIINNHNLELIDKGIKISMLKSNLYRSVNGYYMLIDDINQENGMGDFMPFLSVNIFDSLEEVRKRESNYNKISNSTGRPTHFYEYISDRYGTDFPEVTDSLIYTLPDALNFNSNDLSYDERGMEIVNEAIRWNHDKVQEFDSWFPAVLAYYGKCYQENKEDVRWITKVDSKYDVTIPYLVDGADRPIFDPNEFYKVMYEWPSSIQWAGDWNGFKRRLAKMSKSR